MEKWKAKEKSIEETNDLPIFISSPLLLRPLRPMIYVGIKSYWKNCWQKKYKYLRKILFESQEADTQDRRIEKRFRCWIRRGCAWACLCSKADFKHCEEPSAGKCKWFGPLMFYPQPISHTKKKHRLLSLDLRFSRFLRSWAGRFLWQVLITMSRQLREKSFCLQANKGMFWMGYLSKYLILFRYSLGTYYWLGLNIY